MIPATIRALLSPAIRNSSRHDCDEMAEDEVEGQQCA
jgi:hypothetical protein